MNEATEPLDLDEQRRLLRPLLALHEPADALTSYYALWHDARRTRLTTRVGLRGQADGFVAVSQTGADLFRPLVTVRVRDAGALQALLLASLQTQRSYQIAVPLLLADLLTQYLEFAQPTVNRILELDPRQFEPVLNVLVQAAPGPDGSTRYQIESRGLLAAMSGTNWRSPHFAEVFVYVHPGARGRGWGRSVVSACSAALLAERVRPLYTVQEDNPASARVAEALGYADSGARELVAECRLKQ